MTMINKGTTVSFTHGRNSYDAEVTRIGFQMRGDNDAGDSGHALACINLEDAKKIEIDGLGTFIIDVKVKDLGKRGKLWGNATQMNPTIPVAL